MIGRGVKLATIAGVRIMVHPSWFVIFALVVVSLASMSETATGAALGPVSRWVVAVVVAASFFASVVAHELAHAIVGRRRGVRIDEITLFIFGGAASMEQESPSALTEALIAGAGPLTSGVLGVLLLGISFPVRDLTGEFAAVIYWASFWLGISNLLLCAFNLIPAFPMDGGRLLRALLWGTMKNFMRATRIATIIGRAFGYLVVVAGLFISMVDLVNGIWLVLIGWFLNRAAGYSYRRVALEQLVEGIRVRDVMESDVPVVNPNLTLDTLAEQHLMSGETGFYAVVADGKLVGTVDIRQIRGVQRSQWTTTRVGDVMSRDDQILRLTEPQPILDAVNRFEQSGASAIPVVAEDDRNRLLGMLTRDGLLRAVQARARLRAGTTTP
jgi:Zn-dependent protease/predicted transcriptional regulator